jgi:acetate kinase
MLTPRGWPDRPWAGFALDNTANSSGGPRVSPGPGPTAWVIPTNEELMIATHMQSVLHATQARLAS